jgi:nucleoside-diphosphate-sugar epimerase
LLAGAREIRLGSLHPTRDFVFVKDTAAAFANLADCADAIGREVNIATGREISVGALAEKLIERLAPQAAIVSDDDRVRPSGSEVERLCGSAEQLRQLTGWAPSFTLEHGLDETIAWLSKKENLNLYKTHIYNV